jgi:hypothetical protein
MAARSSEPDGARPGEDDDRRAGQAGETPRDALDVPDVFGARASAGAAVPELEHVATHDFTHDIERTIEIDGDQLDLVLILRRRR